MCWELCLFLSAEFEDAMKKREHEFRTQVDEMNAKVLEYDLKVCWSICSDLFKVIYSLLIFELVSEQLIAVSTF